MSNTSDLYYIYLGFQNTPPDLLFNNPKTEEDIAQSFRNLSKKFHPDLFSSPDKKDDLEWATKIFVLLGQYRNELSFLNKRSNLTSTEFNVQIGKREIKFTQVIYDGDLSIILRNGLDVLKVLKDPDDIDLYKSAEKNLRRLRDPLHFDKYLPGILNPVSINIDGVIHPGQHLRYIEGYTLEEVKSRYPVLDIKHATWMINRVLEILSHSHEKGIANMAVLPRHIIINPETHGGTLLDWSFSTIGKPIAVASTNKFGNYPDFVFKKRDDVRYADIIMLFDIYKWLVEEDNIPNEIRIFCKNISDEVYKNDKTIDIYQKFQIIINGLWKRAFLKFNMN